MNRKNEPGGSHAHTHTDGTSESHGGTGKPIDTQAQLGPRKTWKQALADSAPLRLATAHDALTARIIEASGMPAYQVGGFATAGSRFAYPDVDLIQYGEISEAVREILAASTLPVLVDADDGYGDSRMVTRVVQGYEAMGASAIFLEDQVPPKRCGHMAGKTVAPAEKHASKIRAAVAARRSPDTFILARTDARGPEGLDEALRRAELYARSGADGVYVEALESVEDIERTAKTLRGLPLATTILEGGGKTPWMDPVDLGKLGYSMLLYPTTVLFQVAHAIQHAVLNLKAGHPMPPDAAFDFRKFEDLLGLPEWAEIENRFEGTHDHPLSE